MIQVEESVVIQRPVEEVFAFLTNHRNDIRWQDGLLEVRLTPDGPVGIGTRVAEVRKFLGRRMESTGVITEFIPNVKSARKTVDGPMDVTGYLAFEPVSEGTKVTQHMEMHTRGFMALADALVAGSLRRGLTAGLGDAKALLESGLPAGV